MSFCCNIIIIILINFILIIVVTNFSFVHSVYTHEFYSTTHTFWFGIVRLKFEHNYIIYIFCLYMVQKLTMMKNIECLLTKCAVVASNEGIQLIN